MKFLTFFTVSAVLVAVATCLSIKVEKRVPVPGTRTESARKEELELRLLSEKEKKADITCKFDIHVARYPKDRVTQEVCDWRCAAIFYNSYGECFEDRCDCLQKSRNLKIVPAYKVQEDFLR